MIVAIIIGIWFFRLAKEAELNKGLWAGIGVISFILGQFLLAFLLAIVMPELFGDFATELILGLIGGALGVGIAYYVLQNAIKNKPSRHSDSDLIDRDIDML